MDCTSDPAGKSQAMPMFPSFGTVGHLLGYRMRRMERRVLILRSFSLRLCSSTWQSEGVKIWHMSIERIYWFRRLVCTEGDSIIWKENTGLQVISYHDGPWQSGLWICYIIHQMRDAMAMAPNFEPPYCPSTKCWPQPHIVLILGLYSAYCHHCSSLTHYHEGVSKSIINFPHSHRNSPKQVHPWSHCSFLLPEVGCDHRWQYMWEVILWSSWLSFMLSIMLIIVVNALQLPTVSNEDSDHPLFMFESPSWLSKHRCCQFAVGSEANSQEWLRVYSLIAGVVDSLPLVVDSALLMSHLKYTWHYPLSSFPLEFILHQWQCHGELLLPLFLSLCAHCYF